MITIEQLYQEFIVFKLMCEWEEELGLNRKILAKWKYKHGEEWMKAKLQELVNES